MGKFAARNVLKKAKALKRWDELMMIVVSGIDGQAVAPVIDLSVRGLCVAPYEGHPHGCPNFSKRPTCPPAAPLWGDVYDLTKPTYAIINQFDLAAHVVRMMADHPNWSYRQASCCLYWQGTARKELHTGIETFKIIHPGYTVEECPEAMGVDVTKTVAQLGIILEWPPRELVYKVALAGIKNGEVIKNNYTAVCQICGREWHQPDKERRQCLKCGSQNIMVTEG